jgi:hypothetical protein
MRDFAAFPLTNDEWILALSDTRTNGEARAIQRLWRDSGMIWPADGVVTSPRHLAHRHPPDGIISERWVASNRISENRVVVDTWNFLLAQTELDLNEQLYEKIMP